jgi:hypothetical protein
VEVVPRGEPSVGAVEAVARLGAKGMVLPGNLFQRHPGREEEGVGNGGFGHILLPLCSEVFYAQTYPYGARLTSVRVMRRV